jgi:hypothetical protein
LAIFKHLTSLPSAGFNSGIDVLHFDIDSLHLGAKAQASIGASFTSPMIVLRKPSSFDLFGREESKPRV